jgi:ankyrin repeat protein
LASHGVNVNIVRSNGWTPLRAGAADRYLSGLAELPRQGALKAATLPDGRTALDLAVADGHAQVAILLGDPGNAG